MMSPGAVKLFNGPLNQNHGLEAFKAKRRQDKVMRGKRKSRMNREMERQRERESKMTLLMS